MALGTQHPDPTCDCRSSLAYKALDEATAWLVEGSEMKNLQRPKHFAMQLRLGCLLVEVIRL